jgi:hypothetical protein
MLEAYNSVIVYDSGMEGLVHDEAAYCIMAHNLTAFDARTLSERLTKQFELNAHVVKHRNFHDGAQPQDCELCQLLFEEVIEVASKWAKGRERNNA